VHGIIFVCCAHDRADWSSHLFGEETTHGVAKGAGRDDEVDGPANSTTKYGSKRTDACMLVAGIIEHQCCRDSEACLHSLI
jgi:hypothetical protein